MENNADIETVHPGHKLEIFTFYETFLLLIQRTVRVSTDLAKSNIDQLEFTTKFQLWNKYCYHMFSTDMALLMSHL